MMEESQEAQAQCDSIARPSGMVIDDNGPTITMYGD